MFRNKHTAADRLSHQLKIEDKNEIWSDVKKHYDIKKQECENILKMLKKCCDYFYKIHFILKLDANILITQLNWLVNDLLKALVTNWIAWIQLFDFTVKHVFRNKHTAANELFCWLKIENENK